MTTRRGFLAALAVGAAAFVPGCGAPGHCIYLGGGATPECSEFAPGQVVATARARAGETVAQLRDRILTELASSGVDPAALAGLLGWGISSQPGVDDDVLIGGLSPEQVTEADAPVYPENWEFLGDEIVAFFVLDIKGVVDIDGSSVAEDAASEVPAAGEVVILRDGRIVAEATSTSVVGEGDRVVVY